VHFSHASILLAPRNGLLDEIEKVREDLFEMGSANRVPFGQFVEIVPVEQKKSVFHGCGKTKIKGNDPFQHLQPGLELSLAFIILEFLDDVLFKVLQDGYKKLFLILEVVKDRPFGRSCGFGDFRHRGFSETFLRKEPCCTF
jgi:hypothetical protein